MTPQQRYRLKPGYREVHKRQEANWRAANPESALLRSVKQRAKRLGIRFTLRREDVVIPALCPVLGIPLMRGQSRWNWPSVDRDNPARGYVPGNVTVMSYRANMLKNNASVSELRAVLRWLESQ